MSYRERPLGKLSSSFFLIHKSLEFLYSRNSSKVLNFLIPHLNGRCVLSLPKTSGKSKIRKAFFNHSSSGLKFQRSSLASWKVLYFFIGMLYWKRQYFLVVIIKRLYSFSKDPLFLTRKEEIPRLTLWNVMGEGDPSPYGSG